MLYTAAARMHTSAPPILSTAGRMIGSSSLDWLEPDGMAQALMLVLDQQSACFLPSLRGEKCLSVETRWLNWLELDTMDLARIVAREYLLF